MCLNDLLFSILFYSNFDRVNKAGITYHDFPSWTNRKRWVESQCGKGMNEKRIEIDGTGRIQ